MGNKLLENSYIITKDPGSDKVNSMQSNNRF